MNTTSTNETARKGQQPTRQNLNAQRNAARQLAGHVNYLSVAAKIVHEKYHGSITSGALAQRARIFAFNNPEEFLKFAEANRAKATEQNNSDESTAAA